MTMIFAATDPETLKNLALGLSGASVLVAIVLMKVISSVVGKVVSTAVFVGIAFAGYSQRAEISDCVDKVKAQATASATVDTTCTFFGQDINVKVPLPSK
jgi:uncharacterized PurR-regulated membrane protein YhhQ (DUF165 family)